MITDKLRGMLLSNDQELNLLGLSILLPQIGLNLSDYKFVSSLDYRSLHYVIKYIIVEDIVLCLLRDSEIKIFSVDRVHWENLFKLHKFEVHEYVSYKGPKKGLVNSYITHHKTEIL